VVGIGVLTLFAVVTFFVPTFGGLFMEGRISSRPTRSRRPNRSRLVVLPPCYAILRAVPNQRLGALHL
jgi:hypothetical protein